MCHSLLNERLSIHIENKCNNNAKKNNNHHNNRNTVNNAHQKCTIMCIYMETYLKYEDETRFQPYEPTGQGVTHFTTVSLERLSCRSSSVCMISWTSLRMPGSDTRDILSRGSRNVDGNALLRITVLYLVATCQHNNN